MKPVASASIAYSSRWIDAVLDDDHGAGHAGRVGFAGDLRPLQTGHIQALPNDPRHGAKYASARRACGRYDRLVRLSERVHLIGSGEPDLLTTDPIDSQVYLIESAAGHVVVDGGAGRSIDAILANVAADGLDAADIGWLLITHAHADHAGAGFAWRERIPGLRIGASVEVAGWLEAADEEATAWIAPGAPGSTRPTTG